MFNLTQIHWKRYTPNDLGTCFEKQSFFTNTLNKSDKKFIISKGKFFTNCVKYIKTRIRNYD